MSGNFTLFTNDTGTATGVINYVQDAFDDLSLPANSNTGFTDTTATNPNKQFFENDDCPRYQTKTLYVKDLLLIEDRTKWINNEPTYQIIWSENFPAAYGYCVGNVRLRNQAQGKCIEVRAIGDMVGVSGVIRKIAWIVNGTSQATGTAELFTDGADLSQTITFGGLSPDAEQNTVNDYALFIHNASNSTKDIHDYELKANQSNTLHVSGVVVYFENATTNIDCFPGSTYLNKSKVTTTSIAPLALPVLAGKVGARSVVYKTNATTYAQSTIETPYISTLGIGSSGTNLVNVTTGQGGSFPVGTGIVGIAGTSTYIGAVIGQSTDTLTVSPTLGFGLSGLLYKTSWAGPTIAINASLYVLAQAIDLVQAQTYGDPNGFGKSSPNDYYFSHPELRYRIWGNDLTTGSADGYPGIGIGTTLAFLQIDGTFSALEFEFSAAGILHGTFSINGIPTWGINSGFTGSLKRTVFSDSGPGWNSVVFTPGASFNMSSVFFTKINIYDRRSDIGITMGQLSEFNTFIDTAARTTHNATLMSLGGYRRIYSDSLHLAGSWVRGVTHSVAGGVYYVGASTNSQLKFQYYGTNLAFIGTAGTTVTVTLDGASFTSAFNVPNSVATLGFHTVLLTCTGGTTVLAALDYLRPQTGEQINVQKFVPRKELTTIPTLWTQSDTPRHAKDGDLWAQDQTAGTAWFRLFGRWFKIALNGSSDDPNALTLIRSHGSSVTAATSGTQDVEHFNFVSWSAGTAASAGARSYGANTCDSAYLGFHHQIDGYDTTTTVVATHQRYNKASWSILTTRTTPLRSTGGCAYNGYLYNAKGFDGVTAVLTSGKWNGSSWAAGPNLSVKAVTPGAFVQNNLFRSMGGDVTTAHDTINTSDTASTSTVVPVGGCASASSGSGVSNSNGYFANDTGTNSYIWNGASWSSAVAITYSPSGTTQAPSTGGYNINSSLSYINGGSTGSVAQNNTAVFNNATWSAGPASSNSRSSASGSII